MVGFIIDVREPDEYALDHIDGAINIPLADLLARSSKLDLISKDAELVVYCRTGNRSSVAISALREQGYTNLKNGINPEYIRGNY